MSKRGLGRGLEALLPRAQFSDEAEKGRKEAINEIQIGLVKPNAKQPRRYFNEEKLRELAASISEHGIVQPIVVRPVENGEYEIVAGERRWKACKLLGMETIPAVIKEINEQKLAELALIENIQREDLNPMEEALAYKRLLEEFMLTQEQLSKRLGKSRPFIANTVRLLNLGEKVQEMVMKGDLTSGHARTLLALTDRELQMVIALQVIKKGLSVRQTEDLVKKSTKKRAEKEEVKVRRDPILRAIEDRIRQKLGTKVKILENKGKGKIEIEFYSYEDLQRILESFGEEEL